jgi:hypothetical protein
MNLLSCSIIAVCYYLQMTGEVIRNFMCFRIREYVIYIYIYIYICVCVCVCTLYVVKQGFL